MRVRCFIASNVPVERRAAAQIQPKLLYPNSSKSSARAVVNPKCERAAELEISAGLDTKRRRLTDAAPTKIADRGGDAHLPANDKVERRGYALPVNEAD